MTNKEKVFDLVTDPPCRNCDYWDTKGHHCFQNIKTNSDNSCDLSDQIIALFEDAELPMNLYMEGSLLQWVWENAQISLKAAGWRKVR